jgi:hypothetical protein
MYYKGCIIKDGKIPMSDYTLTEEGLENILKHQDIPFVNAIYEKIAEAKLIRDGNDIFAIVTFDPAKNPFIMFDIDEDLGYWYFNPMFFIPGLSIKNHSKEFTDIYIDRLSLDLFDKEYRSKDPETVDSLRITRYFKAEEAYAKKNQTTDNGSN